MFDFPEPLRPVIELNWSSLYTVSQTDSVTAEVNKPAGDGRPDGVRLEALENH
jgi:hypothetical protein